MPACCPTSGYRATLLERPSGRRSLRLNSSACYQANRGFSATSNISRAPLRKGPSRIGARAGLDESSTSFKIDYGDEPQSFTVTHAPTSSVAESTIELPLGLTLEEEEVEPGETQLEEEPGREEGDIIVAKRVVVVDVYPEGNAAASSQISPGDIIRGTSAVIRTMVYPAANVMLGGIGRPSLRKMVISADGMPFETCMDALRSNSEIDGSVTLITERLDAIAPHVDEKANSSDDTDQKPIFDPRIFE